MANAPFETLVSAHHSEIYRFLRRVTGRRDLAEDLSQETFLRAFRAHRSLRPGSNARAWLFVIAANVARNEARRNRREQRLHQELAAQDSTHLEGVRRRPVCGLEAAVQQAVLQLPQKQRVAFTLRQFHGCDYPSIAMSIGCTRECARAHVYQALKTIRHRLNGAGKKPQR